MLFQFCFASFPVSPPPIFTFEKSTTERNYLKSLLIKLVFLDKLHASNTHFIIREIVAIGSIENEPKSRPIVAGTVGRTR